MCPVRVFLPKSCSGHRAVVFRLPEESHSAVHACEEWCEFWALRLISLGSASGTVLEALLRLLESKPKCIRRAHPDSFGAATGNHPSPCLSRPRWESAAQAPKRREAFHMKVDQLENWAIRCPEIIPRGNLATCLAARLLLRIYTLSPSITCLLTRRLLLHRYDEMKSFPKVRRSGSDLLVTALHHAKCLLAAKIALLPTNNWAAMAT